MILVASTFAATTHLGVLGMAMGDLPDAALEDPTAQFPIGGGLVVPLRWAPRPGAALRGCLALAAAPGEDTVTWVEDGVLYESRDHWAMVGLASLTVDAEVELWPEAGSSPFFGAGAGGALTGSFHSFGGDSRALLDPSENDLDDPDNVDPYTLQLAPTAEVYLGLRVGRGLALDAELAYALTWVAGENLQKAPAELQPRRLAYALDTLRLAVGLSFPL